MKENQKLEEIREEIEEEQEKLQKLFDSLKTSQEKFYFIFALLTMTQKDYLKFKKKGNNFFSKKNYTKLKEKLRKIENLDIDSFLDFINEELIKSINSGHVYLTRDETVVSEKIEDGIKINEEENEQKENVEYYLKDDTLILKIRSFKEKYLSQAEFKFAELEEKIKNKKIKNVILDIRGNKGGTDEYFKYLSMFANKDVITKNRWKDLILYKNYEIEEKLISKGTDNKYNIYLLIDNKVFSTADTLARVCKETGFAKLIGEQTLGSGYGLTISNIRIKRPKDIAYCTKNGIEYKLELGDSYLYFSIDAPINEKGNIDYKLYNTKPDIKCSGEKALEYALEDIKKRQREEDNNEKEI